MEQFKQNDDDYHKGEHYLRLLGLEHLADQDMHTSKGTIKGRDFSDVCGDHAQDALAGFEAMDPNDPDYDETRNDLRELVEYYVSRDKSD